MPAGRPTKYDPAFCERVVELGKEGYSKASIAAELGVVRATLDDWAAEHPEFSDAITRAREFSQGWWETQGREGIWAGSQFNANAYRLQVMNRFPDDWRDKHDVNLSGSVTSKNINSDMSPEEAARIYAEELKADK